MKKFIYFIVALSVSAVAAKAQTTSGTLFVGGGLSYSSEKNEGSTAKNTAVTFSPSAGYFLADNVAVGLTLSVSSGKNDATNTKTSGLGLGPFARYYIHTSNENFVFFAQAALTYSSGKRDVTIGATTTTTKTSEIDFALSPGFGYFFNEHWSAELVFRGIGYNSYDPNTNTDNNKTNTFEIGLNSLTPSLGLRYYF